MALVKRTIAPLAKAIEKAITDANSGKAGRRATAVRLLEKIPADMAAYITIKEVVSAALHQNSGLTTTAYSIGKHIEDELRLAAFEGAQPGLYHLLERRVRERGSSPDHAMSVFIYTANKFKMDLPAFPRSDKLHLGVKLVELFIETTGFVKAIPLRLGRHKTKYVLQLSPDIADWIKDRNVRAELLRPYYMPTVKPPRPWTSLWGGGYHSEQLLAKPLVKAMSKAQEKSLEKANLSLVYDSLNAIQNTGWRINARLLEIMQDVWARDVEIAMPFKEDQPLPPKPVAFDEKVKGFAAWARVDEKERRKWKEEARSVYEQNAKTLGKRLQVEMLLATADDLKAEPVVYFPHQLDFRGRAYAMPVGLNPQGPDHARALLLFSEGKPITTPRAAGWLAIHGANLWGEDKGDFEDRIAWVQERHARIEATAADPLGDLWWTEADGGKKAWSFLAWIFEYAAFLQHGDGYVSSLPISVDGSCNGLQHFSAMLRDPVGGAAVNLVPGEKPNDIYQRVADRVNERLNAERDEDWMKDVWCRVGVDRKITKRPVMVLPYGGTFRSCLQYVKDGVNKRFEGGSNPFGEELKPATLMLSQMVWASISDVVVAARDAMDWLQKVARIAAAKGHALSWTAPDGFVAYQGYRSVSKRRVKTRLHGSIVYLTETHQSSTLDRRRQTLGIAPNFVHSMDAAAMMLTIELAKHNGITQFAMIHDSYGSVAADMDMLSACLREAFVAMYVEHNVLEEFLLGLPLDIQAECPPIPPMGNLDIEAIRDSEFFFA